MAEKKLTMTSSKETIFKAYEKLREDLAEKEGAKLDPTASSKAKKEQEIVKQAESVVAESVVDQIASLQKNLSVVFANLTTSLTEDISKYSSVKDAIAVQESKLQELYGIENQAYALVALVNANEEAKSQFDAEAKQRKDALKAELDTLLAEIKDAQMKYTADTKEQKAKDDLDRSRQKAEWEYNFKRDCKIKEDKFFDELEAKRKEFQNDVATTRKELADREAALDTRELEVAKKEAHVAVLEGKVADFVNREEAIKQEAADKAKKQAETSAAIKETYIKKDYESQIQVLRDRVALLEQTNIETKEREKSALEKADQAYVRMQELATHSVRSANDAKVVIQNPHQPTTYDNKK